MRRFGIVIFGASKYDRQPDLNNERFANSAAAFKKTFDDPAIIGDGEVSFLNLYNKRQDPSAFVKQVIKFVQQPFDDFILYYCGHGVIPLGRNAFSVYLRTTETTALNSTALGFRGFLQDLERFLVGKRAFIVIDACYSGEVIREIMDANAAVSLIDQHLVDSLPKAGMAVATASEPSGEARALQEDTMTLYTGNLLETLREGIQSLSNYETLSWQDVNDHVADRVRERLGSQAPIPRLLAIRAKDGDITKAPFFINKAYRRSDASPAEHAHWEFVAKRSDLELLEDFLTKFPNGIYKALAVARMTEVVASETRVDVLQRFLQKNSMSIGAPLARSRIATVIEWEKIKKSPIESATREVINERIESLRSFIEKFPEAIESGIAQAVIVSLEWGLIRSSSDIAEIERFMDRNPYGEYAAAAKERLHALRLDQKAKNDERDRGQLDRAFTASGGPADALNDRQTKKRSDIWTVMTLCAGAMAVLAALSVFVLPHLPNGFSPTVRDLEKRTYQAASGDITLLRNYLATCVQCEFSEDAKKAIAALNQKVEDDKSFALTANDPVKLQNYLNNCGMQDCSHIQEARDQLRRMQGERGLVDAAGFDPAKLHTYLNGCIASDCIFRKEAQDRLNRVDSERKTLDAAGFDSTKLRAYLQSCAAPGCLFGKEAQDRLDRIGVERKAVDAAGYDPTKLRTYLQGCAAAGCVFGKEAQDSLDRIDVERKAVDAAGYDPTKLRAYLQSCAAQGCIYGKWAQDRLDRIDAERKALDAAGYDPTKLRAYLQSCAALGCVFGKETQDRLDRIDSERKTLDAAGFDATKLRAYLQSCAAQGCTYRIEAQNRLDRIDSERKTLDAAGFDATKLRNYLQGCAALSCVFAKEAQDRLDRVDGEAKVAAAAGYDPTKLRAYLQSCTAQGCIYGKWAQDRLDRIDSERKALDAAGFDATKLRNYLQGCAAPGCIFAKEAQDRLDRIDSERKALDAAGFDATKLRSYLQGCAAPGCIFAKEAQDRLVSGPPPVPGNADFVEYKYYDSPQNDDKVLPNVDLGRCVSECRSRQCSVYTYDRWNNWCYIKSIPSKLVFEPKSTTWILRTQRQPGFSVADKHFCYHDAAIPGGGDGTIASSSRDDCEQKCKDNNSCLAFMFVPATNRCTLFSAPPVYNTDKTGKTKVGIKTQAPC